MDSVWFFLSVLAVVSGTIYCFRSWMLHEYPEHPDPTAELVKRVEKLEQIMELKKLR